MSKTKLLATISGGLTGGGVGTAIPLAAEHSYTAAIIALAVAIVGLWMLTVVWYINS